MNIVSIFANKLFAFHYDDEDEDELSRLLNLWNDTFYLNEFLEKNKADIPQDENINQLPFKILSFANEIDDKLDELSNNNKSQLEEFFAPLDNQEYHEVELSKQKGRKNYLRIYALKIDENCYVITGGAIKFTHLMEQREHTNQELIKINRCRDYLKRNDVFDADSFYEFLIEERDEQ